MEYVEYRFFGTITLMTPKKLKNENDESFKTLSVWDFVSLVSHQLRNPLASTKLSIETLLNGDLGSLKKEQEEYLYLIAQNNQKMIGLVKNFLTISQIERGEIELHEDKDVNISKLADEVIKELIPFARAHNASVTLDSPSGTLSVTCDRVKLREVMTNFVDNAIKYNKHGGKIYISLSREDAELKFEVKDNGIGIPERDRNKIFSKFYRAENAGRVDPEGTGIGLYLAHAIIEKSGGKIGFESEENKGSTFWFTLPIAPQ